MGREERRERRRNRRENRVWNDGTWFWQDEDRVGWTDKGDLWTYGDNSEGTTGFGEFTGWLRDAVGMGEGGLTEGWGVGDDSGMFSGWFGTGDDRPGQVDINPDDFTEAGEDAGRIAEEKFQSIYDAIAALAEERAPELDRSLLQGYDEQLAALDELAQRLAEGPTEEDYDKAYENAARLMGLTPEEAEAMIGDLTRQMAEGVSGQQGMSEAEMELRRRQNQTNLREAERRAQQFVQNTMADTGSSARMLQAADEAARQINDFQLQQDTTLANQQAERRMAQFQSKQQSWAAMVQTNQMGVDQYITNMYQGASLAMEAYMAEIQGIAAKNQTVFQAHQADLQTFMANIDAQYKAITLELGATAAELDYATGLYTQMVQPVLDALMAQMAAMELNFGWDDIMDLFGVGLNAAVAYAGMGTGGGGE